MLCRKEQQINNAIAGVVSGAKESLFLKIEGLHCIYALMEMTELEREFRDEAERLETCWSVSGGR